MFRRNGDDEPLDIAQVSPKSELMRQIRGNEIAIIFQEPMTSLNPVYTVGNQIAEAIVLHEQVNKKTAHERAIEMIARVGIPAPTQRVDEYPHQLSGGMRQRVMIAMALCCSPMLLIADEPTTALDVTIQAQVLGLMQELQAEMGMAIMLITHDLGVIADLADEVVVMYSGRVVEKGTVDDIFYNPSASVHARVVKIYTCPRKNTAENLALYTRNSATPVDTTGRGVHFKPRCSERMPECEQMPELAVINGEAESGGHAVRCWLHTDF